MRNRKITFVIGAGASFEVGLPIGEKLKSDIADMLKIDYGYGGKINKGDDLLAKTLIHIARNRSQALYEREVELKDLLDAAHHISESMPAAISIDNFVNSHKDNKLIEKISKLVIVRTILKAESGCKLALTNQNKTNTSPPRLNLEQLDKITKISPSGTWYNHFFKLFNDCQIDTLSERLQSISLIIFNYDRCVEHYLHQALQIYYRIAPEIAADFVNSIEIYHPYGTVGELPWQVTDSQCPNVSFGEVPDEGKLLAISESIRTFSESTDENESEILAIKEAANNNKMLVFLGFSYLKLNIDLLDMNPNTIKKPYNFDSEKRILGTGFGISPHNLHNIKLNISHKLSLKNDLITIDREVGCAEFFKQYDRSMTLVLS